MRSYGLALCIALAAPASAQADPAFYFGGIFDFANAFSDAGAPSINQLRRGDSPLDNMQARLFADVVFAPRLTVFNQIVIAPTSRVPISYFWRPIVQFSAVQNRRFELFLEAGKLATSFGNYGPRAYSNRNPLISTPLTHHYFTSLRSHQLPADNADLLKSRGQGRAESFTGYSGEGSAAPRSGLSIVYDSCWDTGLRAFGSLWRLEYSLALTQGTLSDPRSTGGDNNEGKQVVARLAAVPARGLMAGASYARGAYLDAAVAGALQPLGRRVEDFVQEAIGVDLSYEVRHLTLIGEVVFNRWEMPRIVDAQGRSTDLTCIGWYAEGRYAFLPGLYGAVRYDRITFGKIGDGSGQAVPWDDDIWRVEAGLGYYFWDGVLGKVIVQDIHKARTTRTTFGAVQLSLTF